jgi:hypothetical protein
LAKHVRALQVQEGGGWPSSRLGGSSFVELCLDAGLDVMGEGVHGGVPVCSSARILLIRWLAGLNGRAVQAALSFKRQRFLPALHVLSYPLDVRFRIALRRPMDHPAMLAEGRIATGVARSFSSSALGAGERTMAAPQRGRVSWNYAT